MCVELIFKNGQKLECFRVGRRDEFYINGARVKASVYATAKYAT